MKKAFSILLAITLAFALAACGGSSSSAAPASANSTAAPASEAGEASSTPATDAGGEGGDKLRVAMLLPGTINDGGWNASAYEGLLLIEERMGAEIKYSEKVAASDIEEVFRSYAEMGFDLVIGHGFEYGDGACAVAPNYPDTFFAITSSDVSQAPNVCGLQNRNDEQGFLAGVVAALESESGVIGCVGGMEIPSITAYVEGLEMGAKYINPDINVLSNYTGNFDDVAAVKQMAEAMIAEGADIVTHDANQAGLGVFEAAEATNGAVKSIGAVSDQYELSPDTMIVSACSALSEAIALSAQKLADGTLEAQGYYFGIPDGTVYLSGFHGYELKDGTMEAIDEVMAKLESGEIEVGILGAKD